MGHNQFKTKSKILRAIIVTDDCDRTHPRTTYNYRGKYYGCVKKIKQKTYKK